MTTDLTSDIPSIDDYFLEESLLSHSPMPWFAKNINFLATGDLPAHLSTEDKGKFLNEVKNFYLDDPYLFKNYPDQIFQRCIPDNEVSSVIKLCHSEVCGSHFSSKRTTVKILQSGFYWPTMFKDTHVQYYQFFTLVILMLAMSVTITYKRTKSHKVVHFIFFSFVPK